ncbi:MAG: hypothetical protein L3K07_04945 [Thermoplasmata archaeon]|nr:hypothetical protein [Thermoplasmata archaeon]
MIDALTALRGVEGLILVLGSAIAVQSFRAYRRTRESSLVYLGAGFLLISLAAASAGVLYELVTHDLLTAWIASSAFDAAGFLVILYSIYRRAA